MKAVATIREESLRSILRSPEGAEAVFVDRPEFEALCAVATAAAKWVPIVECYEKGWPIGSEHWSNARALLDALRALEKR